MACCHPTRSNFYKRVRPSLGISSVKSYPKSILMLLHKLSLVAGTPQLHSPTKEGALSKLKQHLFCTPPRFLSLNTASFQLLSTAFLLITCKIQDAGGLGEPHDMCLRDPRGWGPILLGPKAASLPFCATQWLKKVQSLIGRRSKCCGDEKATAPQCLHIAFP